MKACERRQKKSIIGKRSLGTALTVAIMFLMAACGQSIGPDNAASMNAPAAASSDYLRITRDDYGLQTPNFYYSTDNAAFWSIQASVADSVNDPNFATIIRIDAPKTGNGVIRLAGGTFSLGADPAYERFPGTLTIFNGHASVHKKVEQGTISFSAGSDESRSVSGAFNVIMTDYDSPLAATPSYIIAGEFSLSINASGPANPLPSEVYPAQGKELYDESCASCHALGEYDSTAGGAPELAMRGGELPTVYDAAAAHHQAIALDEQSMTALRIFANAW